MTDVASFWRYADSHGIVDMEAVDRTTLRKYLGWLMTDAPLLSGSDSIDHKFSGDRSKSGYASKSVARKLSALRTLFGFLVREGDLIADPTLFLNSARPVQKLPIMLDYPSVEKLLNAPSRITLIGARDRAILECLYAVGLRVSELVGLNIHDIDLRARNVLIRGKGDRERLGIIGRPARDSLIRYLEVVRPKFKHLRDQGALFLNRYGDRLTERSVQKLVHKYALECGIDGKVHPHTLRHSFATHMLDGGADLRDVQELLGHSTPTTTEIYTHVTKVNSLRTYLSAHPKAKRPNGPLS